MTLAILTVTAQTAWLTQDAGFYRGGQLVGHAQKVACVPGKLLYGMAGNFAWLSVIAPAAMAAASIDDIPTAVASRWRWSPLRLTRQPLVAYFAGRSPTRKRVIGYCLQSYNGMAPELLLSGHHSTPAAATGFLEDPKIAALAGRAERGHDVDRLHELTARHIAAAGRAGTYGSAGQCIGGVAQVGRVDRDGVEIHDLVDLDGGDLDAAAA